MSFSLSEILAWTGGRLENASRLAESGISEGAIRVERPVPLEVSGAKDIAFFFSKNYQNELRSARPGILITAEPFVKPLSQSGLPAWERAAVVTCADPYLAMAVLSEKFAEKLSSVAHPVSDRDGMIHPTAVIHPAAVLARGVRVDAHCVVESGARIGEGTTLYPGCYVGPAAVIGRNSVLFAGVKLYEWTVVGDRVRIHAGSVLGSDGFGYAPRRDGKQVIGHQKIFHLGRVVVGDGAEIGACCSLDRGTFGDTFIGPNAKLDNQVHIGHNARVDEGGIICGGTCLAGRAHVGKYAYVGGLVGIANDVFVGDGASVGALALISKDVPAGGNAVGNPQREFREHFKVHAILNKLLSERGKKNE